MIVKDEIKEHLRKHIVFPTTKKKIIEACNMMTDVPKEDKEWFEKNLPDWSFRNADEIIRTVQIVDHLGHVNYPTSKKELAKACDKMTDVPRPYREWFKRSLPERSYESLDDVLGTLKGITHVREHVTYPTTKTVIVETCNRMGEVPEANREWFMKFLPERNYYSPEEVIKALKI